MNFETIKVGSADRVELDSIRARIVSVTDKITETGTALLAIEDARQRLEFEIDSMMKVSSEALFEDLRVPDRHFKLSGEVHFHDLIALLGRDAVIDRIMGLIKSGRTGKLAGISNSKRKSMLEQLRTELLQLCRDEELEVLRLEAAGNTILRRGDADLDVLLQVWAEMDTEPEAA